MILTTKTKLTLASMAYRVIAGARGLMGKDNWATVRRAEIQWCLDLREGIDFSIYLLGAFERSTVIALEKLVRQGDVTIDIGANIGAHTLRLARSVGPTGRVFAFEPADFAFAKLKRNLALNPELEKRTRAYQVWLVAEAGAPLQSEIYASWPLQKDGNVHAQHRGRLVTALRASGDTLDDFVERERIDRLDLIKIDVDGHEYPILKGALRTLAKFHPVLVMEMSPYIHQQQGHNFGDFIALLRQTGYTLLDVNTWKPLSLGVDELESRIPDGASINVIALVSRTADSA
jgi:FkbM family methyltransferase